MFKHKHESERMQIFTSGPKRPHLLNDFPEKHELTVCWKNPMRSHDVYKSKFRALLNNSKKKIGDQKAEKIIDFEG